MHGNSLLLLNEVKKEHCYSYFSQENLKDIQPNVSMSRVPLCKDNPPAGAHCMCFLSDVSQLVTMTMTSDVQILHMSEEGRLTVHHTFPHISGKLF